MASKEETPEEVKEFIRQPKYDGEKELKFPRLKSVAIAGLYTYRQRKDFSVVGNKLILVGPNGSGKSNLICAITFAITHAPDNPHNLENARFTGENHPTDDMESYISLQFELDESTKKFIAEFIVYSTLALWFPTIQNFDESQLKQLQELIEKEKKNLTALHLTYRRLKSQDGINYQFACYGTFTDNLTCPYVPFFDSNDVNKFCVFVNGFSQLNMTTDASCEIALSARKKFTSVKCCLEMLLKTSPTAEASEGWYQRLSEMGSIDISYLKDKIQHYGYRMEDICPNYGHMLAKLLRKHFATLPQDRGLYSQDKYHTAINVFTIEVVLKLLTTAALQDASSGMFAKLKAIQEIMKENGVNVKLPLRFNDALNIFLRSSDKANVIKRIDKIESDGVKHYESLALGRYKQLIQQNLEQITLEAASEFLNEVDGDAVHSTLEKILDRNITPNVLFNNMPEALQKYEIKFSTQNNPYKDVTLRGLYGGAQQLLIILTTLYIGEFGTIILDEPEMSLHISAKSWLKRQLKKMPLLGPVVIIATHAEEFIAENTLKSTYRCYCPKEATEVTSVSDILDEAFPKKAPVRAISSEIKSIFFAERILFVEGVNDARLLEVLLYIVNEDSSVQDKLETLEIDAGKLSSWNIVSLSGSKNVPSLCAIAHEAHLPWVVILDRDYLEKPAPVFASQTNKKSIPDLVKTVFKNNSFYEFLDKLHPDNKIISQIAEIATNEEYEIKQQYNEEWEQAISKKEQATITEKYDKIVFEHKAKQIRQLLGEIKEIFMWQGEMEHIFLRSKAAQGLHKDCQAKEKHLDIDSFVMGKNTGDSLHDLWGHIMYDTIVDAVALLILEENKEFINLCKYLSDY